MDCMQVNTMTKAIVIDAIVPATGMRVYTVARQLAVTGGRCWRSVLLADRHDKMIGY